jgi:hypothetical protein
MADVGTAELDRQHPPQGEHASSTRVAGPVRVLLWVAVRAAHVVLYLVIGWIYTAITGQQFLSNWFTSLVGMGIFVALPATALVSATAWLLPVVTSAARRSRGSSFWVVMTASVIELVATLFLFLAWLPSDVPLVLICVILSVALASTLPLSFGWRGRPERMRARQRQ